MGRVRFGVDMIVEGFFVIMVFLFSGTRLSWYVVYKKLPLASEGLFGQKRVRLQAVVFLRAIGVAVLPQFDTEWLFFILRGRLYDVLCCELVVEHSPAWFVLLCQFGKVAFALLFAAFFPLLHGVESTVLRGR